MSVSIADIKTRLEALLGDIDGIETVLNADECQIVTLPAVEVFAREGAWKPIASGYVQVTRNFDIFLYVAVITQLESDTVFIAAMDECFQWVDAVAAYFIQRPRLERGDSGIVFGTGDLKDSGAIPVNYRGQGYAAIRLTLPVITIR